MTDELHEHAMLRREKAMADDATSEEPDPLEEYDLHHGGLQQRKDIIE